jgi:hypothetical protein
MATGVPRERLVSAKAIASSFPGALVEIDRQEPTRFVFQQWVTAHHVSAPQVISNNLVFDRDEGGIRAITAFASGLEQAEPRFPFV